ncbi:MULTISPECIES: hypothetical protein [unclassified Roseateles]|uniref:SctD/MshK family protein n=1 Tax=unclassified Roseateles TaxID=2626991 RepID=UPI0006FA47FA|nr:MULTISPECIES: hypothetical protein [unclassified Roseateles]
MLMKPLLELRVLAGRQAGARARLEPQQDLLICSQNAGNQGDTQFADILLSSQLDFHARLTPTGPDRVGLQLISGHAVLAERALEPGITVHAWAPGQPLELGDTRVAYGPADQAHWPEPVLHDGPELLAGSQAPQRTPAPAAQPRPFIEGVLTALGLVMVTGGVMLAWQGGTLREAGQVVAKVMPASPAAPATAASPAEQLAGVMDVFRLHGVRAQAAWSPDGELVLRTQERDAAKVQAAADAARRDVARLPKLRVDNQPPVVATATPAPPAEDPAKRLVAVVDNTDSPYFVTADGARYFSGALLPSGHRVVQIAERSVTVERDGQRTQLTL